MAAILSQVFPLAHVGIGRRLIPAAVRESLPWRWVALGCLLPDLVDKPVWLAAQWLGVELPQLESARLFGHTAWFAIIFAIAARLTRRPSLIALAWAIPTHLILDVVTDFGRGGGWGVWKQWLFWPLEVPRLGIAMAGMLGSPLHELGGELRLPVNLIAEVVGAALLLWDLVRSKQRPAKPNKLT